MVVGYEHFSVASHYHNALAARWQGIELADLTRETAAGVEPSTTVTWMVGPACALSGTT